VSTRRWWPGAERRSIEGELVPIYALGDLVPVIDPTAYVHPDAVLIGAVTIGPEASVWAGAVLRADMGRVSVGARTSIQDNTVVHTTREWPTVIGAECVVGHIAHLEGCTVEDRCLIGSGSVVLNRARVGAGSVVGAQALVAEDTVVPPRSLMLGVPARPRPLDLTEQEAWIDVAVREYVDNARLFRDQLRLVEPDRLREKP
jgi:carbonic anhydrase/acetyltransferase-like protein (isoleucine patch superfamily)